LAAVRVPKGMQLSYEPKDQDTWPWDEVERFVRKWMEEGKMGMGGSHSISRSAYLFISITTFKESNISKPLPYLVKSLSDDLMPTSEALLPCHNS